MNMTVHLVTQIKGVTLVVFHTEIHCWQFQIIINEEMSFIDDRVCYAREAAEEAGRDWIAQLHLRQRSHLN